MANWITHMMIADILLERFPWLDRTGFCVGSIAPDCNIENDDWTAFTPPREVTHWMRGSRKTMDDCERFWQERVAGMEFEDQCERSFYLGYYAHLVADAHFQVITRDPVRVGNMLARIVAHPHMAERLAACGRDFDAVKRAFDKRDRIRDIEQFEYEYIMEHPRSAYMTVLRGLREFPGYAEFLPPGAIVRKIGIMAGLPKPVTDAEFVFFSREEQHGFVADVCEMLSERLAR